MINSHKYFLPPPNDDSDFKELFKRLAAAGAGRSVDKDGFPKGPWTPELLAEAISRIDANQDGIDLRTVQLWFQDNDRGISTDNIRWLARVLGCDDPAATSQWQMALSTAQTQLATKRREQKCARTSEPTLPRDMSLPATFDFKAEIERDSETTGQWRRKSLAEKCEWLLSGEMAMNLLIAYWLVFGALGLMNYTMGTLSVTYSPSEGLEKQVGFIWAPTLTVLPLLVLPLYILSVSDLISFWKFDARLQCIRLDSKIDNLSVSDGWMEKVKSFSFSFWAIGLFCYLFVFAFQWAGIYLPAYAAGDPGGVQIDRYLVALLRPDVISIGEAMFLSAVGYHYTASYIAVFMLGLLFLVIVVVDYCEVCRSCGQNLDKTMDRYNRNVGRHILWGGFRIAVHGLLLATLIKLQIVYLSSDGQNFVNWFSQDALSAFGLNTSSNGWLDNNSVSHFTTFLMMAVVVAVFGFCAMKVRETVNGISLNDDQAVVVGPRYEYVMMIVVISLLSANLLLVGQFVGFSLLVVISAAASSYVLRAPKLRQSQVI